jgi:short subunit dehydrogenase-like uncharacterized protein
MQEPPMTRDAPAIVVIGATGYTGGLIVRELARDGTGFVLAARDPERLKRVAAEVDRGTPQIVDVTDPASLRRLIRPGDAVINTAGPFTELGEPVVRACIEIGAHYLDTTGEQPFMHAVHSRHHDAARAAGVAVVNAMAFEYALGDGALAAAAQALGQPLRSVDVIYAWRGTAASAGTRRTVLRMLGRRGWVRVDDAFRRQAPGSERRTVRLASGRRLHAVTFGSGEVVTAPRYQAVETVRGWLVTGARAARVAPRLAPALPVVMPVLRPLLEPLASLGSDPTEAERRASRFTIRLEVEARDGTRLATEVHGTDPYGLTAVATVLGARRAMAPGAPAGVLAPSQLLGPDPFFEALATRGVERIRDPDF